MTAYLATISHAPPYRMKHPGGAKAKSTNAAALGANGQGPGRFMASTGSLFASAISTAQPPGCSGEKVHLHIFGRRRVRRGGDEHIGTGGHVGRGIPGVDAAGCGQPWTR